MAHERFHYKFLEEIQAKADELGVTLPFAASTQILAKPLTVLRPNIRPAGMSTRAPGK